ncbi:MAG: hypothetical protein ABIW38_15425 [Ferruginibacter sp.]
MKKYILVFSFIPLLSCTKEEIGHTKSYLINSTNHNIKILPYIGASLDNSASKTIPPNSTIEVYAADVRGKTIDPSFGTVLQPYDSVVVSYDDVVKIPHIKFNLAYSGMHRVLFSSNRSISNQNNYLKTITSETKNSIEGNFKYTFTEQDYLDAR